MIELLKEQCYHSNMVNSIATNPLLDNSHHGEEQLSPGCTSPVTMTTNNQELSMTTSVDFIREKYFQYTNYLQDGMPNLLSQLPKLCIFCYQVLQTISL